MFHKRIFMAMLIAMLALPGAVSTDAKAQDIDLSSAATDKEAVREYYQGVRQLYREAARMLGAAVGPEARAPIISLQRHCSRSLGGIKEKLNLLEFRQNDLNLRRKAEAEYFDCKRRFDQVNQG